MAAEAGTETLPSLFPYGKSGLKSLSSSILIDTSASLPVWEEWIEIPITTRTYQFTATSLPVWEEWIEILSDTRRLGCMPSLPVWEEWIEIFMPDSLHSLHSTVSSRMGRVD